MRFWFKILKYLVVKERWEIFRNKYNFVVFRDFRDGGNGEVTGFFREFF